MHTIITIEGNIKSGKTDLFNKMYEKYCGNPKYIFINVDDDFDNLFLKKINILNIKYSIMKHIFENIEEDKVIFMKTSFEFDKDVYIPLLYETGAIGKKEVELYENIYESFNLDKYKSDHIFYLKVKPKYCKEENKDLIIHCDEIINSWINKKKNITYFNYKLKKLTNLSII